jgi:hypothetical protein
MTTENAQALERAGAELVHPTTGEVLDLAAPAADLLDVADDLELLATRIRHARRALELELVRRIDARGKRKAEVDGCILETNPPTEDLYDVADVRRELEPLVEAGTVPRETLDALIVQPPPPDPVAPPAKVDRRVVNSLKSSDNRELLAALGRARRRRDLDRKLKVLGRPVNATAEEVPDGA